MAGWISHRRTDDLRTTLNRRRLGQRLGVGVVAIVVSWLLLGPGRAAVTGISDSPESSPAGPRRTIGAEPTEPLSAAEGRLSHALPSSQRIVAIAVPLAMPSLTPGDAIALFSVAATDGGGVAAEPLDIEAFVLSVEATSLTIVVPDHAVPAIFVAQAAGSIEIAVLPQDG